jgi:NAD(P)-dependent dehydrogenase (short-subunit alcohol dehydrogenase family)
VADLAAVPRVVEAIAAELGPIDVLVSNAGVAESAPLPARVSSSGSAT